MRRRILTSLSLGSQRGEREQQPILQMRALRLPEGTLYRHTELCLVLAWAFCPIPGGPGVSEAGAAAEVL